MYPTLARVHALAIAIMVDLACRSSAGPVPGEDLRRRVRLSISCFERIAADLRRHRLMRSARSRGRGDQLGRAASLISMREARRGDARAARRGGASAPAARRGCPFGVAHVDRTPGRRRTPPARVARFGDPGRRGAGLPATRARRGSRARAVPGGRDRTRHDGIRREDRPRAQAPVPTIRTRIDLYQVSASLVRGPGDVTLAGRNLASIWLPPAITAFDATGRCATCTGVRRGAHSIASH